MPSHAKKTTHEITFTTRPTANEVIEGMEQIGKFVTIESISFDQATNTLTVLVEDDYIAY